jgi:hypothetical protein
MGRKTKRNKKIKYKNTTKKLHGGESEIDPFLNASAPPYPSAPLFSQNPPATNPYLNKQPLTRKNKSQLGAKMGSFLKTAKNKGKKFLQDTQNLQNDYYTKAQTGIQNMQDNSDALIKQVRDNSKTYYDNVTNKGDQIIQNVQDNSDALIKQVRDNSKTYYDNATNRGEKFFQKAQDNRDTLMNKVKENTKSYYDSASSFFTSTPKISDNDKSRIEKLKTDISAYMKQNNEPTILENSKKILDILEAPNNNIDKIQQILNDTMTQNYLKANLPETNTSEPEYITVSSGSNVASTQIFSNTGKPIKVGPDQTAFIIDKSDIEMIEKCINSQNVGCAFEAFDSSGKKIPN